MEFRKKGDYEDIIFSEVYDLTLFMLVGIAIVWLICSFFAWAIWQTEYRTNTQRNEEAAEFNARPPSERAIIVNYLKTDKFDEDNLMVMNKVGLTGIEAVRNWTLGVLGCTPIILSVVTFFSYRHEKYQKYYLANLPLSTPYGWVLLFSMFAMWPILFIAFLHMLYLEHSRIHKFFVKKRQAIAEERKQVEMIAKHELRQEEIEQAQHCGQFSSQAKRRYFGYRRKDYQESLDHEKKELSKLISDYQNQLRSLGEKLQTVQRKIGESKSRLATLERCQLADRDVVIAEEWRLITEMRGVYQVKVDQRNQKKHLCILVRVRVPYENVLYDFGDFEIRIRPNKFSCVEVRSGVRIDARSHAPRYRDGGEFCFGDRRSDILDFIQHARMLEAITLAIDCLHSVNLEHEKYIPKCFRTVESIEVAKRRLAKGRRK